MAKETTERRESNGKDHKPGDESTLDRRTLLRRGAATAGALAVGTAATSGSASAQTGIDSCTVIGTPGNYVLTQDIVHDRATDCITIEASDVVLDGQGHTISNAQGGGRGIYVSNYPGTVRNVVVRNVTVTGFRNGIAAESAEDSAIRSSTTTENEEHGIFVNGDGCGISSNTVTGNHTGISTRGSRNEIVANTVRDNELRGIYVRDHSWQAYVLGNEATGHAGPGYPGVVADPGIEIDETTGPESNHVVANNTLRGNGIGILLIGTTDNRVRFNVLRNNGNAGIGLQNHATGNNILENEFFVTGGITLTESNDNLIEKNTQSSGAIRVDVSASRENMIRENSFQLVSVVDSESTTLFDNDLKNVFISQSTGTLVLGNRVSNAIGLAVGIEEARDTLIQGNVISNASGVIGPAAGIGVSDSVRTDVWSNAIRDNDIGVRIAVNGAETTTVAANNIVGNSEYGIKNELETIVDGRFNYWGASNGPSSPPDSDGPLRDPVTGRLANGDGDAVSRSPKPEPVGVGISNVRFNPWSRVQQAVVILPRFRPPLPIDPPSPIEPPFLPPFE